MAGRPEGANEAALSEAGLGIGKAASGHWETLQCLRYETGSPDVGVSRGDIGRARKTSEAKRTTACWKRRRRRGTTTLPMTWPLAAKQEGTRAGKG